MTDGTHTRRSVLQLAAATAAAAAGGTASFWQPAYAAEPGTSTGFSADRFARPGTGSMPLVLWFWNGTVTPALVDATLADMRGKGVTEVLVFPFDTPALRPVFFTEAWFDIIEHTLREADRHHMRLWLFDDDFFPSGRAGGFVVNGGTVGDRTYRPRPDLRAKNLSRSSLDVDGGTSVTLAARALTVAGGRLSVDAASYDGVRVLAKGTGWGDCTVTATVRVERANAGLMVRCSDAKNGYLADLRADGGIDIWRQRDGGFTLLRQGGAVDGFDADADHELTVSVRGSDITPALDGAALTPVRDTAFATGTVGVRATATQRSSWDSLTVADPAGAVLYTQSFEVPSAVDDFETPADLGDVVAAAARPAGATGSGALARMIDLTDAVKGDGNWTAPAGRWQVDTYTSRPLADATGSRRDYLDLLDDEAVDLFMDTVPGEYLRRFPWAVGGVLRGFADDEPFIASADAGWGKPPWSPSLAAEVGELNAEAGLGIVLTAVHDDLGGAGDRLRGVFWRAVSNRFAAAYYRRVGTWMGERGLELVSNPLWDEYGPAEQIKSTGNLNTAHQWAQVPGTDLIFDHMQREYHRILPRWPASAAHQTGRRRVYLEAMGGTGWGVTPALTREVIGSFVVRGVNKVLLHARFSDADSIVFPPPFQPVNPWWDLSKPLNEWIGRLVEAARATAKARTALVQPQRAAESVQDRPEQTSLDTEFVAAVHAMEDVQIDFDLLDEGALDKDPALIEHARTRGSRLAVGHQEYGIVVLPRTPVLSVGAVDALTRFVNGGGVLVAVGDLATREPAGRDEELARALDRLFSRGRASRAHRAKDPAEAAAMVASAGGAAATLSPAVAEVRVLRLERAGGQAFLMHNERAEPAELTATFPALGVPEVWDPDTGSAAPAGVWRPAPLPGGPAGGKGTAVPLRLEAKAAIAVVFRTPPHGAPAHAVESNAPVERLTVEGHTATATVRVASPMTVRVVAQHGDHRYEGALAAKDPLAPVPLDGDWSLRFDRDSAPNTRRPLGSWTDLDPAHSGSAVYEREFTLDARTLTGRRWSLDLGEVRDVAEITVNGTELPARLWTPYRSDVTSALRAGANVVRVRVTNTGANAHGDTQPSGLLGPVLLRPERLERVRLSRTPR
ncbi:glycosyl hydrolase [Streptomyces scopuliridis]|uniref:Glycosyl hydrolase n=1 Tax=Streptomyces scopuliridis TaxID=452529 RepID=A0ACD4ZCK1_9ACTN|nr:glycosyl hydrolase [Streptomyces scopuliridis]WSB95711.1 glycosyl hydrolase [Streptomyces scopuliridis]WSC10582.1 glycosyl hydrolase [Streptomyces scopuliridis]